MFLLYQEVITSHHLSSKVIVSYGPDCSVYTKNCNSLALKKEDRKSQIHMLIPANQSLLFMSFSTTTINSNILIYKQRYYLFATMVILLHCCQDLFSLTFTETIFLDTYCIHPLCLCMILNNTTHIYIGNNTLFFRTLNIFIQETTHYFSECTIIFGLNSTKIYHRNL